MPRRKTHKNTTRKVNDERAWEIAETLNANGKEKRRVALLIQKALADACRRALARDDVRDGKPQRKAFKDAGGKIPPVQGDA